MMANDISGGSAQASVALLSTVLTSALRDQGERWGDLINEQRRVAEAASAAAVGLRESVAP